MADQSNMKNPLELAEVIQALRQELITAQQQGQSETIKFNLNSVEVELETVVEKEIDGKAGGKVKFWVVDANAELNGKYKHAAKQKIKLSLEAVEIVKNPDGTKLENKAKIGDKA